MIASLFPDCRHASPEIEPGLRACRSPKLVGLKQVSPETCRVCYCRNHPDEAAPDPASAQPLVDCLYLDPGPANEHSLYGVAADPHGRLACRHPQHDWTTRAECGGCRDYQFPLLSPAMSVEDVKRIRRAGPREQPEGWWRWPNVIQAQRELADEAGDAVPPFPAPSAQRGIVVVGGGKYFPSAYVTVRVLRHVGTRLPIQLWHLAGELTGVQRELMTDLGVECVDADELRARHPFRFIDGHWWKGWQLKAYALLQCPFREVLLLDADCYPVRDPESIFEWRDYRESGAVFWPDIESSLVLLTAESLAALGVSPFEDRPTESGQLLIHRERCWRELQLAAHLNAQADFTYQWLWGDKDTFPIAWRLRQTAYARMWPSSRGTQHGIVHFDQHGDVLFQHRCTAKFTLEDAQFESTPGQIQRDLPCGFLLEGFCRDSLQELADVANRNSTGFAPASEGIADVKVGRHQFRVRRGSCWDREILKSVIEFDEYGLWKLAERALPIAHVVDIGAHIGGFSRLAKQLWPSAHLLAFEPAADSADLFDHNLRGVPRVHLVRAAAWHSDTDQLRLSDAADGNESARFTVEALEALHAVQSTTNVRTVEAVSLIEALRAHQFDQIDILKLDCEGSEALLLEHLQAAGYLGRVHFICGEWHHRASVDRIVAALSDTHRITLHDAPGAEWGGFSAVKLTPCGDAQYRLPGKLPKSEPTTSRLSRCERSRLWIRSGALGLQDGGIIREVIDADVYGIADRPCSMAEVVVDVGAHIGSFAVHWHHRNPDARIACIEACPENIPALQANVGEFATIVAGACTYETGPLALLNSVLEHGINTGGTQVLARDRVLAADFEANHYWKDVRSVATYSLEDILDTLQADRIDVLKLDCEGSEYSILEHTPSLHCIRFICGEFHGRERWERFRERRFAGWSYRLLSACGDLGIFHLENPTFEPRRRL